MNFLKKTIFLFIVFILFFHTSALIGGITTGKIYDTSVPFAFLWNLWLRLANGADTMAGRQEPTKELPKEIISQATTQIPALKQLTPVITPENNKDKDLVSPAKKKENLNPSPNPSPNPSTKSNKSKSSSSKSSSNPDSRLEICDIGSLNPMNIIPITKEQELALKEGKFLRLSEIQEYIGRGPVCLEYTREGIFWVYLTDVGVVKFSQRTSAAGIVTLSRKE